MGRLFAIICILVALQGHSQPNTVEFSEGFDEPRADEKKVFICSNKNTLLFVAGKGVPFTVDVYDANRKHTQHNEIKSKLWQPDAMRNSAIIGMFNIRGHVAVFLWQAEKKFKPCLYRLLFSADDGKLVQEDKLAELPEYPLEPEAYQDYGTNYILDFHVEKDQSSDAYAVAILNNLNPEKNKRLEVVRYDGNHKEIARSYCETSSNSYRVIGYIGMVVKGTETVYLASFAYNPKKAGGKSIFVVSKMDNSGTMNKEIPSALNLLENKGIFLYNPISKAVQLLSLTFKEKLGNKRLFVVNFNMLDESDLSLRSSEPISTLPIKNGRKVAYDDDKPYEGMPMEMVVNQDGSTTIGFEETAYYGNDQYAGDVGVLTLDATGKAMNGFVARKSHKSANEFEAFSHDSRRTAGMSFRFATTTMAGAGFYSYQYLGTGKEQVIVFNDHPKNFERDAERSPKMLTGISDANTIAYYFEGGKVNKSYLFGAPDGTFENRFAYLNSGFYSSELNQYAVMIIENKGKKKDAHIAWVNF